MSTYSLTLTYNVTKNGAAFVSGTNSWSGVDGPSLGVLLGIAAEMVGHAQKVQNKGGPITVVLDVAVASLDGTPTPPIPGVPSVTYTGLTLHGLSDVEREIYKISDRLLKLGRDHADRKEGVGGKP